MPKVADFIVIKDNPFDLQKGEDIDQDFSFTISTDGDLVGRSVIVFRLNTFETETGLVQLRIDVNGSGVMNQLFGGDAHRTIHEAIRGNILKHGNNEINFVLDTNLPGLARISDVVLWYKVNIGSNLFLAGFFSRTRRKLFHKLL
jgi:hypothetical protein